MPGAVPTREDIKKDIQSKLNYFATTIANKQIDKNNYFKIKFDNYFLWRETVMIVPSRSIVPVYSTFAGVSNVARRSDSS